MGIVGGSICKVKNKNCARLSLARGNSLKLYEIMYNRPHTLYLHRKKVIFDEFRVLLNDAGVAQLVKSVPL